MDEDRDRDSETGRERLQRHGEGCKETKMQGEGNEGSEIGNQGEGDSFVIVYNKPLK